MKMQLLCKNHPYSCVIEKGIHGKIHRREVGCAIIFKRERSYTTALCLLLPPVHPAILASNSRLQSSRQCPTATAASGSSSNARKNSPSKIFSGVGTRRQPPSSQNSKIPALHGKHEVLFPFAAEYILIRKPYLQRRFRSAQVSTDPEVA